MEKRYIFDADTHVSPYSNFDKSINACQWEERMERAGVAHAIVWLLPQGVVDVTESNRYIGREAQKNKRMVPFGWANIREGAEKARGRCPVMPGGVWVRGRKAERGAE